MQLPLLTRGREQTLRRVTHISLSCVIGLRLVECLRPPLTHCTQPHSWTDTLELPRAGARHLAGQSVEDSPDLLKIGSRKVISEACVDANERQPLVHAKSTLRFCARQPLCLHRTHSASVVCSAKIFAVQLRARWSAHSLPTVPMRLVRPCVAGVRHKTNVETR